MRRVLVVGDSLAFHGPRQPELLTDPRLWPQLLARHLGVEVDVLARLGMTARDAWWTLAKDPYVYSVLLPRADAVVLAVGSTDQLPASLPTFWRDAIAYLRPGWLRRRVRLGYHRAHPYLVRASGARLRVLGQVATDHYLSRCVAGIRHYRPGVPVVGIVPPPYAARYHGGLARPHAAAVAAARAWGARERVPLVDLDALVSPYLRTAAMNPDGMHWGWQVHVAAGLAFADVVRAAAAAVAVAEHRDQIVTRRVLSPDTSRP